jgi:hypothetical protein
MPGLGNILGAGGGPERLCLNSLHNMDHDFRIIRPFTGLPLNGLHNLTSYSVLDIHLIFSAYGREMGQKAGLHRCKLGENTEKHQYGSTNKRLRTHHSRTTASAGNGEFQGSQEFYTDPRNLYR